MDKYRKEAKEFFDSLSREEFKNILVEAGLEVVNGEGKVIFKNDYDSLPVAIDKILKDETIDDKTKLERIATCIDVYFQRQELFKTDYI